MFRLQLNCAGLRTCRLHEGEIVSDSATTGLSGNTSLLRPEIRILLAAAGIGDEAERAERIRALVRAELDWDFLGEIAERDQVVGLVYQALSGSEPGTIEGLAEGAEPDNEDNRADSDWGNPGKKHETTAFDS